MRARAPFSLIAVSSPRAAAPRLKRRVGLLLVAALVPALVFGAVARAPTKPGLYFATLRSGTSLPRAESLCARLVTRQPFERRADNATANHTIPNTAVPWARTPGQLYWRRWIALRRRVTGRYEGTTDEIIRWSACKWGVDENVVRAVAVTESDWRQSLVGDGGASFGLLQVKDHYSDGTLDFGGWPWTQNSTALNADFYAAWIRACLDNAFYDGGTWLYGGKSVKQLSAANGFDHVFWGCVGAWYSGDWYSSDALGYVARVERNLAGQAWLHLRP